MARGGDRLPTGVETLGVVRYERNGATSREDHIAVEEPLEIRVAGEALAVTMRTPGHDRELALGFLFAEGLIAGRADVGSAAHCGRPGQAGWGNVIDVVPGPGAVIDTARTSATRRGTLTTSACGVCGRRSIDDLLERTPPVGEKSRWSRVLVAELGDRLRARQANFHFTGGLHAAAIARHDGSLACVFEDVGRHNAVDKALGYLLLENLLPAAGAALVVSGRSSFEIVQKAIVAGIGMVVAVSAPTSLAVRTAERANVTLVGFARAGDFNVYTHPDWIADD